jgi:type IV pilus assembly protein PilC
MTWPVIELVAAIFVIAGMLYLMSILSPNSEFRPLPWFSGPGGATLWLICSFGMIAAAIGGYYALTRSLKQKETVDRILLWLPIVGPCLEAIALARFCLSLRLTMETGMKITSALRLAMRATGNAAFEADMDKVSSGVRGGEDLVVALERSSLFPRDFLNIVATGEEGGRVPEIMQHQAEYYEEEAGRRMTMLTRAAGWGLYAMIGAFIIFLIFTIYGTYISQINNFKL